MVVGDHIGVCACGISFPYNAAERPEIPNWITVDQLAHWLENSNKLSEVDVYSVISKTLGFIAYYGTPLIHHGLCVVAADPETYHEFGEIGESYNEIFIASITEGWEPGDDNDDNISDKMSEACIKIDKLVLDIIQNHSESNLEQRQINWINNKGRLEYIATVWFESNGYFPNSSFQNPDCTKMKDINDATPAVKLPPKAKGNPRAAGRQRREQNSLAKADTALSTQVSQQTQYINSQTEAIEAAPSPSSDGATIIPSSPLVAGTPKLRLTLSCLMLVSTTAANFSSLKTTYYNTTVSRCTVTFLGLRLCASVATI